MIIGINNLQYVIPVLVPGSQQLEEEYCQSDWLGFVTSGTVIRHVSGSLQPLSSWLPDYPAGTAILSSMAGEKLVPQWCQNEKQAMVFMGSLENAKEIRADLWDFGYEFQGNTDKELLYTLTNRYLDVGMSPFEAMKLTFLRLQGRFAVMAIFAQPEQRLIVGSRGYPLGMGVLSSSLIVGSNIQMLKQLYQSVMALEEGKPLVLCSV
ncbi:MAG: hypothetical protein VSS75_028580 [Candidatus Parabeggiatoa sp.]|nr:hypothetical protein [Candidatus Parabeggiatoa sp.]